LAQSKSLIDGLLKPDNAAFFAHRIQLKGFGYGTVTPAQQPDWAINCRRAATPNPLPANKNGTATLF
jgi:hypothetical protein